MSSASTRSRTTATVPTRHRTPRRQAQRRHRSRHLRLRRRDAETGQVDALGTDAIKVGQIYKPDGHPGGRGPPCSTATEFVNGGDPAPRSRPSLAQAYKVKATGGVFIADINHLKSKGSACSVPDAGDGQGNCNAVPQRLPQRHSRRGSPPTPRAPVTRTCCSSATTTPTRRRTRPDLREGRLQEPDP